jgi:hypothetical protein
MGIRGATRTTFPKICGLGLTEMILKELQSTAKPRVLVKTYGSGWNNKYRLQYSRVKTRATLKIGTKQKETPISIRMLKLRTSGMMPKFQDPGTLAADNARASQVQAVFNLSCHPNDPILAVQIELLLFVYSSFRAI